MATRPIVPRANGEGSLGVTSKYWGNTFTQKLNGANAVDMTDFSTATLRQPSTTQSVGDIRYHSALPTGYYLECTTPGITAAGDITPSSTIGATVTDGTVVWTVGQITDKFPVKKPVVSDIDTVLENGIYYVNTATQNKPDSASYAILVVVKADTMRTQKYYPIAVPSTKTRCFVRSGQNGSWSAWQEEEAIVAKSLGINGYIKYASGLTIQWGTVNMGESAATVTFTFPVSINNIAYINATCVNDYYSALISCISYTTTGCTLKSKTGAGFARVLIISY
jgi:hypothetical protein